MKLFSFITLAGILTAVVYGVSKTIYISRLAYLIQTARVESSQLGVLVTVSNPLQESFTQNSISADLIVNGKTVSRIEDSTPLPLAGGSMNKQGWIINLPGGVSPLQLVQIKGTVKINNLSMPLNLRYKFLS